MTTALIDADIVAYRCAASCENEPKEVALLRAAELMQRILNETQSESYIAYLTGPDNFRYKYNPDYKANRKDVPKPKWLQDVREYLVVDWNASVEDGQEADDAMGITQMATKDTVICTIDKDLLMIPGEHYNFISGVRREQHPVDANRHFYWQLIMGDRTDNIFGCDGKARQTVPKKLEPLMEELASYDNELDMFNMLRGLYNDDNRLLMNGICLWIRRNPDEIWQFPT
jgi:5'-3' exonuclease